MRFRVNHPQVINEIIDGEGIMINLATGSYYSLDSIGGEVWILVEQSLAVDQIVTVLQDRYDASDTVIRAAVENLLEQLALEELVERDDSPPLPPSSVPSPPPATKRRPFEVPRFEKFTDMQDLILLDPVHEVGPRGWPHIADGHAAN